MLFRSVEFPTQEYCSGLPFPSPRDFPNPGIKPMSPVSPALAGEFFISATTWEAHSLMSSSICQHLRHKVSTQSILLLTFLIHKSSYPLFSQRITEEKVEFGDLFHPPCLKGVNSLKHPRVHQESNPEIPVPPGEIGRAHV